MCPGSVELVIVLRDASAVVEIDPNVIGPTPTVFLSPLCTSLPEDTPGAGLHRSSFIV